MSKMFTTGVTVWKVILLVCVGRWGGGGIFLIVVLLSCSTDKVIVGPSATTSEFTRLIFASQLVLPEA